MGDGASREIRCCENEMGSLPAKLAMLPTVAVYVFFVWLTQYLIWHGTLGLLEQHAFLVPAPLLGL